MSRPRWLVGLLKKAFPGRFLAAGATRMPVLGRMVDDWLFAGDDLIYLPKNRVIPINKTLGAFHLLLLWIKRYTMRRVESRDYR